MNNPYAGMIADNIINSTRLRSRDDDLLDTCDDHLLLAPFPQSRCYKVIGNGAVHRNEYEFREVLTAAVIDKIQIIISAGYPTQDNVSRMEWIYPGAEASSNIMPMLEGAYSAQKPENESIEKLLVALDAETDEDQIKHNFHEFFELHISAVAFEELAAFDRSISKARADIIWCYLDTLAEAIPDKKKLYPILINYLTHSSAGVRNAALCGLMYAPADLVREKLMAMKATETSKIILANLAAMGF